MLLAQNYPQGDGALRIFNYHLNEFAEIRFREQGKLLPEGVAGAQRLLRSRDNDQTITIDTRLLDLVDHLQDRFGADQIEIISGYRSRELNKQLETEGHAVSPVSLHMKGQALDIHIDEVKEETLRDYLLKLNLGGVGYYGPMDFIHIDTGPVKQWGEPSHFKRKLVGVLKPEAPIQLTSDKNDYLVGDKIQLKWSFKDDGPEIGFADIHLEHFYRGQWQKVIQPQIGEIGSDFKMSFKFQEFKNPDGSQRYGKHRWIFKVKGNDELFSSNEFYLKKK